MMGKEEVGRLITRSTLSILSILRTRSTPITPTTLTILISLITRSIPITPIILIILIIL